MSERTEGPSVTRDEFRAVMGSFAAGVTVVTTLDEEGQPTGLTATAFSSLSADPPLALVCVDRRGKTHRALVANKKLAVNILAAGQKEISQRFAGKADDKFAGIAWRPGERTGCPVLPDALASMELEVTAVYAGGDHDIFVGSVVRVHVAPGAPLLYFRGGYRDLAEPRDA